jgi:hypothetical protein
LQEQLPAGVTQEKRAAPATPVHHAVNGAQVFIRLEAFAAWPEL